MSAPSEPTESFIYDERGIARGFCNECDCKKYLRRSGRNAACSSCDHFPTDHEVVLFEKNT